MNARVATFINNHEDEIDTDDFHSVFTAAYQELNNDDTKVLYNDLCDTFGTEVITKQRNTALYFIVSMIMDDISPNSRYTFGYIHEKLMHYNILGLSRIEFSDYLNANAREFGLETSHAGGISIYRKRST